jgi:hypothetical protein
MDGIIASLAIAVATIFSPAAIHTQQMQAPAITNGVRANEVIYFDAPIHRSSTYLR